MARMPEVGKKVSTRDMKRSEAYARNMAGQSREAAYKDYSDAMNTAVELGKKTPTNSLGQVTDSKAWAREEKAINKAYKLLDRSNDIAAISRGEKPTYGSGINKPSPSVVKMLALEKARKKGGKK